MEHEDTDLRPHLNYRRIAEAIAYIQQNFRRQPGLDEVAGQVHLSPFHFQRLFREWAGTSPKKFLQYISLEHAKALLQQDKATLFDAACETGLSGPSRLHDLFVTIESMTPAEYKNGGASLAVRHGFVGTPFGSLLVAATDKGVCYMAFDDLNEQHALEKLRAAFPNALLMRQPDAIHQEVAAVFQKNRLMPGRLKLHLKGTDFQLKVWEALLKIPSGNLSSYQAVAERVGRPRAVRAVGTAIGSNPVAYLIPCHRVIQSSGALNGYRWGDARKAAMIGWEVAARTGTQTTMHITRCTPADADTVLALYQAARTLQAERNVVRWPPFDKAFVEAEIAEGRQWKLTVQDETACNWVVTYDDAAIWEEKERGDAIYLHRIATHPGHRGNNFIAELVAWAVEHARQLGRKYVRLDTLGNNTGLIRHYTRAGFTFLGIVRLADTRSLPVHYQQEPDCCLFELAV